MGLGLQLVDCMPITDMGHLVGRDLNKDYLI